MMTKNQSDCSPVNRLFGPMTAEHTNQKVPNAQKNLNNAKLFHCDTITLLQMQVKNTQQ